MTPEQIIELAKEASVYVSVINKTRAYLDEHRLIDFAKLVEAATREECARVCRDMQNGFASDQHIECAESIERMK